MTRHHTDCTVCSVYVAIKSTVDGGVVVVGSLYWLAGLVLEAGFSPEGVLYCMMFKFTVDGSGAPSWAVCCALKLYYYSSSCCEKRAHVWV
jgi:hypothetical protein